MSAFELRIALDAASLGRLHAFSHYQTALEPALSKAMEAGISILQATATDYMDATFINPTGPTENDSWEVEMVSPSLATLTNTAPQGQRLEYGFSGRTDALGRYYPYWPAYQWAEQTVMLAHDKVQDQFQAAIDDANLQLGRGAP